MDLPVTVQMLKQFNNISVKVLHIEPTTVCNAACPQCARENINLYNPSQHRSELSLVQCQTLFDQEFISGLDKMFMCGNFGEPAAAESAIEIFKYFRTVNHNITLGMNTNGSVRNTAWWRELAQVFNQPLDYVVFSIDGLEDTNHIYRRNTTWRKIVENAKSFIDAGGSAHWDMLIYEHNQHQIDECRQLAKQMGFTWFRAKVSKRFITTPINFLNPPNGYSLPNTETGAISCHAVNERSIYVAANGHVLPCCWFGSEVFTLDTNAQELLSDWRQLSDSWNSTPHRICQSTCAEDTQGTSFSKQWKIEEQLK